jgi:MFS family permease
VLLFDFATYVISFCCYLTVRKGRVVVHHPVREQVAEAERSAARYLHEMREGYRYIFRSRYLVLLGLSWALFLAAMLTTGVVSAPLSDRVLHAGAVGYGWLNGGWAIGAVLSALYTAWTLRRLHSRAAVALTMAILAVCWVAVPHSRILVVAVILYGIGGSARGVGGVALNSELMEIVPKHLMGRVQNAINLAGTFLQVTIGLLVGIVAHRIGIAQAFAIIGMMYFSAFVAAMVPAEAPVTQKADATVA